MGGGGGSNGRTCKLSYEGVLTRFGWVFDFVNNR